MMRPKYILLTVLAGTLMFANVVCACAVSAAAPTDAHAHHQMSPSNSDAPVCPHQDCEDCESIVTTVPTDRDANVGSRLVESEVDDDAWIAVEHLDLGLSPKSLTQTGPPLYLALLVVETPITRRDLLLE